MATFAPAFGMIGTLIGLVQMLNMLSDPSSIGPAMAVALLTTFYGTILSTLKKSLLSLSIDTIKGSFFFLENKLYPPVFTSALRGIITGYRP